MILFLSGANILCFRFTGLMVLLVLRQCIESFGSIPTISSWFQANILLFFLRNSTNLSFSSSLKEPKEERPILGNKWEKTSGENREKWSELRKVKKRKWASPFNKALLKPKEVSQSDLAAARHPMPVFNVGHLQKIIIIKRWTMDVT